MNIPAIFSKVYNGKPNWITPNIIRYGSFVDKAYHQFLYELSNGDGIFDRSKKIYGITVLRFNNGEYKPDNELSAGAFDSEVEALRYLDTLKERVN